MVERHGLKFALRRKKYRGPFRGGLRISSLRNDSFITRPVYLSSCLVINCSLVEWSTYKYWLVRNMLESHCTTTKMSLFGHLPTYFSNQTATRSNFVSEFSQLGNIPTFKSIILRSCYNILLTYYKNNRDPKSLLPIFLLRPLSTLKFHSRCSTDLTLICLKIYYLFFITTQLVI